MQAQFATHKLKLSSFAQSVCVRLALGTVVTIMYASKRVGEKKLEKRCRERKGVSPYGEWDGWEVEEVSLNLFFHWFFRSCLKV